MLTVSALSLLASAPAPAPLELTQFKKYGNSRQVWKLCREAELFCALAAQLKELGKMPRVELKQYRAVTGGLPIPAHGNRSTGRPPAVRGARQAPQVLGGEGL
jgi:hypothetical protein